MRVAATPVTVRAARAPETKFSSTLARVDRDGRFCGYASLFGRADLSGDVVMPGAFARTLVRRGASAVRMLLEHDPSSPIGMWLTVVEDGAGLWVEGRLGRSPTARRALSLMAEGRLDGLSIGFRTVRAEREASARVRRLFEIDLWEVSVVSSPMLPEARARAGARRRGAPLPRPVTVSGASGPVAAA